MTSINPLDGNPHRIRFDCAGLSVSLWSAAAAFYTPGADPLYKVTIIPRGQALGGTHMLSESDRHTLDEDYLRGQLVTLLAGRAAERLFIGTVMRDNWLSNRVFKSYDDIVALCCLAWNNLIDRPWKIMSIGMREWAHG